MTPLPDLPAGGFIYCLQDTQSADFCPAEMQGGGVV